MNVNFFKYHGAGNDFIMIDNRSGLYSGLTEANINFLCRRNFGIGADGLIILEEKTGFDFSMRYYNSDGKESTMCGNGGRCITAFARHCGIENSEYIFWAIDGLHVASFLDNGLIKLKMIDVAPIKPLLNGKFLNTGSPHYVEIVNNLDSYAVFENGRKLRYNPALGNGGANVNFVEPIADGIKVRTYERGVENETLACGTGAVASSICMAANGIPGLKIVNIEMPGGKLQVQFNETTKVFFDIWLTGPALFVFSGAISI